MKLIEARHLAGINIHCFKPALEALVDLEDLDGKESCDFADFPSTLVKLLPGLKDHVCGIGRHGGFWVRLQRGTYFGHVAEHVAIELLNMAGYQSSYGKTRAWDDSGLYKIVIQCHWPRTAQLALEMAIEVVEDVLKGEPQSPDIVRLQRQLGLELPGISTQAIIDSASSRGIPVKILGHGSLLRLGTGRHRQYIEATITGLTSCIGVDIACDKILTKKVLTLGFIPTPGGKIAKDEEDAVKIAEQLAGNVVVKPCDGNQGKGVSLNLNTESEVRAAYKVAENFSGKVMVEEQIFGRHYRVLVVDNKVEAASERFPSRVLGDGIHCIKDLVDIENRNPLRGEGHENPLTKIRVDQVVFNVLARQNMTMNYVPEEGEEVVLRDNANLSTGGTAADVTPDIHPENKALCCRVARLLGLDVAGVDIVTEDIALPLLEGEGAIIEVNAAPGIRMHLYPSQGSRQQVGDAIVDYLFPWQRRHSIPLVSVTGTNGKTTTARLIAHVMAEQGNIVGMTSTDGVYIDGQCVDRGDNTGPNSADVVLSDPAVDVAVLETARGGLVRRGLAYDEADVAVVTNIAEDHLGADGIDSLEELCHVKSLVVETVSEDGYAVVNADDERVLAMAEKCPGQVMLFSINAENKHMAQHVATGGRGVSVSDGTLLLMEGSSEIPLLPVDEVPITYGGAAKFNVANTLAAVGALWGLGVAEEDICAGLKSFDGVEGNPGRLNLYDFGSYKVLLDYGHNFAGFQSVFQLIEAMAPRRKVGVVGLPGDRQDDDIIAAGQLCAQHLDVVYIKEDRNPRGRQAGEVAQLIRQGIEQTETKPQVEIISDEQQALRAAMANYVQGDLIVVFYEDLMPLKDVLSSVTIE